MRTRSQLRLGLGRGPYQIIRPRAQLRLGLGRGPYETVVVSDEEPARVEKETSPFFHGKIGRYRKSNKVLVNPQIDPFWSNDERPRPERGRSRSPEIYTGTRVPPVVLPQKKPIETYTFRRTTKVPSTTHHQAEDDLHLDVDKPNDFGGRDVHFSSSSKRLAQGSEGGDSLEFSPNYDEPESDLGTIIPFVQDMYFPHDTSSLIDAFGSIIPDPFISSSEPLIDCDESINDGLNTPPCRSPSPITSPLVSPESSDRTLRTPPPENSVVMYAPQEPEVSPITRRSLRKSMTRSPPVTTPTKALQPLTSVREGRVNKVTPRKRSPKLETPSPERPSTDLSSTKNSLTEDSRLRKRARFNSPVSVKRHDEEVPPKATIVPYVPPQSNKPIMQVRARPQQAIKGSVSPPESEKSFKEIMSNYVDNYEPCQRPGKIKRLKLINFMCYNCFEEEWNEMVNYITADNGAGKSAILVALQLVFGAKASTTMRSACVKDLIQYGKYQAIIEVTLTNDGTLDIETYGTEVVIVRTIRCTGYSGYSIFKADGKEKRILYRKELELIMATLQIMVDNPVMMLNQEVSRNFLPETNPRALYVYFYKGLNLEHCEMLLIRSHEDIEESKKALQNKYQLLEVLLSKAREHKANYDAVVTLENGKERVKKLTNEYHWTIVAQYEEELSQLEYRLDVVVEKCAEVEKHIQAVSEQQNSLDTTQESSKSQLKKLKRLLHSKREELELKSREAHSHRQDLGNANSKLANLNKIINDKTRRLQEIEAEVARLREESNANYQERVRQRENQRQDLLQRKINATERLVYEKSRKEVAYTKFDTCNQAQIDWHEKSEEIQFRIREKRHELLNIEKKQNSKYSRYGAEMGKLMAKIDDMARRGQFKEKPTGPQSACYTVKESFREYAPLIEHILGSTIFQFRVGHVQDKVALQNLMKKVYGNKPQPDILYHPIKNRERYKLLNVKAASGHNTVLDALDILDDDPVIVNWLADSNGIEKILLFPTEEEACDIMKEAIRVPRGCSIAYTLNFKRIHADPHFRSMVINPYKDKTHYVQMTSRLPSDELIKLEIAQLEEEGNSILRGLELAKRETKLAKEVDREIDRDLKAAQNEVNALETSLQSLEDMIVQGPDLASYIEDGEDVSASIHQNMVEKNHLETKVEELRPYYEAAENEKEALEESISATESELQIVENQSDFAKRANDLRIKFKNLNDELTNQRATQGSLTNKMKEISTSLSKSIKVATSKGSKIPKKRDLPAIKEELMCLEALLKKNRHKLGHKSSLKREWERAQEFADEVDRDIRAAGHLINTLIPTITTQFRRFEKKKNDFGNTLQTSFQSLISCRNLGGKLKIDHKGRNLMFWVFPDKNSEERFTSYKRNMDSCMVYKKGMKDCISGLSGGERSFSTICFMVSMWKTMEAPFYVLDEFDVAMDEVNRNASHKILNAHTSRQPEAQFFFITPLKLDSRWYTKNSKILRLYPPIRVAKPVTEIEARNVAAITMGEKQKAETTNKKSSTTKRRGFYDDSNSNTRKRTDGYYDHVYKPTQPLAIKSH